jgi:3-hydroxyisobutyrate dehydrogenase-like beta-hydroxyacid dehydrogenase
MTLTVAVVAAGEMGSGIGRRLTENGVAVLTSLAGRGPRSVARARAAGMADCGEAALAAADIFLSIVPPGEAVALAERMAPHLAAAARKPLYVDCNAVSPQTAAHVAAVVTGAGCRFVDGGIIGGPPRAGDAGPAIYLSGQDAPAAMLLAAHGLDLRDLGGPIGAASALKMSYAGITKGTTAIAAAMILGAIKGGSADAVQRELAATQKGALARSAATIPAMFPKAYRWVAEMREIAAFLDDPATSQIYEGIADLYERLAADFAGDGEETRALAKFLKRP